jgi:hypothetical protein
VDDAVVAREVRFDDGHFVDEYFSIFNFDVALLTVQRLRAR